MNHLHLFYCLKHAVKSTSLASYRKLTLMQTYAAFSQSISKHVMRILRIRISTTHTCMSGLSMPYTVPDLVQLLHFSVFGYKFNDS